jgi:hypothetical protein
LSNTNDERLDEFMGTNKDNDLEVVFTRTDQGKHNRFGNKEELLNNDNSLDKAGMGDVNITNIDDSYKDMPIYNNKKWGK